MDSNRVVGEIQSVKDVISSILVAWKNHGLYPEDHNICRKSVSRASDLLKEFLKAYGELKVTVEKYRLMYEGQVVFQSSAEADNLATLLFRDGVMWLQFLKGIDLDELRCFFRVLKENQTWKEYRDGDLVTAFWEADFSHLQYEVAEVDWESDLQVDFSQPVIEPCEASKKMESLDENPCLPSLATDESGEDLWNLTSQENEQIQKMIIEDEKRDSLSDLLFVLFAFSLDQARISDFKLVLSFLEEELKDSLLRGDMVFASRFMMGLSRIRNRNNPQSSLTIDALDQFVMKISSPSVLNVVVRDSNRRIISDPKRFRLLRRFCLYLHPNAILTIGPVLARVKPITARRKLRELIAFLAAKGFEPLERLLKQSDEETVQELVLVLGQIKGKRSLQLLLRLLKHPSASVRTQAVTELADSNEEIVKAVFDLVEDPSETVRNAVFKKLGNQRNEVAEKLLLFYLENGQFKIKHYGHLLSCYQALGHCGSGRSTSFLEKSLFRLSWFPNFKKSVHRRGAAVALAGLGTAEAEQLLKKGARSFLPAVRGACIKAMEVSA